MAERVAYDVVISAIYREHSEVERCNIAIQVADASPMQNITPSNRILYI